MSACYFDKQNRFVIEDFDSFPPFASFLPGIAGPLGIPLWAFYVNRGQAIACFGVESKNTPIMEFQPANKAYQITPTTGFRTFLKVLRPPVERTDEANLPTGMINGAGRRYYEPFSALVRPAPARSMAIGANELELEETSTIHGLQVKVLYVALPGENFAGLIRQVTVKNVAAQPAEIELLDGLPVVIPYGLSDALLKEINRTAEAWMAVFNLEAGIPFYRVQASVGDSAEVGTVEAGHFYLAFAEVEGEACSVSPIVDPTVVFGANTSLSYPDRFLAQRLAELQAVRQITVGRTPCGLFGTAVTLAPGETLTINAIIGHVSQVEIVNQARERLAQPAVIAAKRAEAQALAQALTDPVATRTSNPRFDAYCRQNLLDNILRGGWPVRLGGHAVHLYGRKHGDLERDYNAFLLAPEFYSQGNANYRDVNQNRRCDVLLNPSVGDDEILAFLGLLQADGYNPLVVNGSRFVVPPDRQDALCNLVEKREELRPLLARPFTPGRLLKTVVDRGMGLAVAPETFVEAVLAQADQSFEATFGEGYWIDHWTYNLDLLDAYLAVYPDKKDELLFGKPVVPFFDSPAIVQPRSRKHVLAGGRVRQYGAVMEDEEKAALIASRHTSPNLMRETHGQGDIYRTNVFAKLLTLALVKFATLDPLGMGIEMEAGKPGWNDALNGLPGLLGSSLCETVELQRLLDFLLLAMAEKAGGAVDLPVELDTLLHEMDSQLVAHHAAQDDKRDFRYWDAVASARESYRAATRLGFDGRTELLAFDALAPILSAFRDKVAAGIARAEALNGGIPPTYLVYEATGWEEIDDRVGLPVGDVQGRPYVQVTGVEPRVLPLFLEGPMHALKVRHDLASARALYRQIKESALFDRELGMYKINASLAAETHEIGRARAFTPGWLENESIWLHMAYKYLLEVLRAGLFEEFFEDFRRGGVPFFDPQTYGRSPLENSSFIVSSAHPDQALHGRGFVARLSGATAEFLSIWSFMAAGARPFFMKDGELRLALRPALPGWLFREDGTLVFTFLGHCAITYHNALKRDTYAPGMAVRSIELHLESGECVVLSGGEVGAPYAVMAREGRVPRMDVHFDWPKGSIS